MVGAIGFEPSVPQSLQQFAGLGWHSRDRNGSQRNSFSTRIGHAPTFRWRGYNSYRERLASCTLLRDHFDLAVASRHRISNATLAATNAVLPLESKGGETSTISAPTRLMLFNPRNSEFTSRGRRPPNSGVPVPGAKAGSMQSTSKLKYVED